jgi:hypothetical protein
VIIASLVLILGAVVLLVLGLIEGSSDLLIGSIGTSLVAAVALVMGVRQAGAARAAGELEDEGEPEAEEYAEEQVWAPRSEQRAQVEQVALQGRSIGRAVVVPRGEPPSDWADQPPSPPPLPLQGAVPSQPAREDFEQLDEFDDGFTDEDFDSEVPPDEPMAQRVSAADAARVARMSADVFVIDGRPRYHLGGCVHLLGRPYEPLPVSEAVELGFSPCGLCEPDSALIADAGRV